MEHIHDSTTASVPVPGELEENLPEQDEPEEDGSDEAVDAVPQEPPVIVYPTPELGAGFVGLKALAKALKLLAPIVKGAGSKHVLACVLIRVREDHVILTSTDYERRLSLVLPGGGVTPFVALAEHKQLTAIAAAGGERLDLVRDKDWLVCTTVGGAVATTDRIALLDPELFPGPDERPCDLLEFEVGRACLVAAAGRTSPFVQKSETRRNLTGVNIDLEGRVAGEIRFTATDGHRLGRELVPANVIRVCIVQKTGYIIPKLGLNLLVKLVEQLKLDPVTIGLGDMAGIVSWPDGQYWFRLVEGTFPNIDQVVPKLDDLTQDVTLPNAGLREALKQIVARSPDKIAPMKLTLDSGSVLLQTDKSERGNVEIRLPAQVGGAQGVWIGVNAKYLLDMLAIADSRDLMLSWRGELSPMLVRIPGVPQWLGVQMPLRIEWGSEGQQAEGEQEPEDAAPFDEMTQKCRLCGYRRGDHKNGTLFCPLSRDEHGYHFAAMQRFDATDVEEPGAEVQMQGSPEAA